MTIAELIEYLTEAAAELGEDAPVRLQTQPNWPFESEIAGVTTSAQLRDADEDDEEGKYDYEDTAQDGDACYICEGRQIGYGSKNAWNQF